MTLTEVQSCRIPNNAGGFFLTWICLNAAQHQRYVSLAHQTARQTPCLSLEHELFDVPD